MMGSRDSGATPGGRRGRVLVFVVVPVLLNLVLMVLYFGPWELGSRIIAPALPRMRWDSWREFGLLESLQNLYLLTIVVCGLVVAWRSDRRWQKWLGAVVAVGSAFVLLEEIDFGLHYYEFLSGSLKPEDATRNLHNLGDNLSSFKLAMNLGAGVLFVLVPILGWRLRRRSSLVAYLSTDLWYLLAFVIMLAASALAHPLEDAGLGNDSLSGNMSEFREHNIYYLALVYFLDLFFCRVPPKGSRRSGPDPT
jgi:hypothetical protein